MSLLSSCGSSLGANNYCYPLAVLRDLRAVFPPFAQVYTTDFDSEAKQTSKPVVHQGFMRKNRESEQSYQSYSSDHGVQTKFQKAQCRGSGDGACLHRTDDGPMARNPSAA